MSHNVNLWLINIMRPLGSDSNSFVCWNRNSWEQNGEPNSLAMLAAFESSSISLIWYIKYYFEVWLLYYFCIIMKSENNLEACYFGIKIGF